MKYNFLKWMQNKKLLLVIPVIAIILGYSLSSGFSQINTNENLSIKGSVTVDVVRDGKLIFHEVNHNLITNMGKNIISKQLFNNGNGTIKTNPNGTLFIALTSWTGASNATQTTLTAEILVSGLQRATATYNYVNSTSSTIVLRKLFTASGTLTAVQQAGLFNVPPSGAAATTGLLAVNTFSSVNLITNDQITITWTITLS